MREIYDLSLQKQRSCNHVSRHFFEHAFDQVNLGVDKQIDRVFFNMKLKTKKS